MLYLAEKIVKEMIDHAREESPLEACGILAGGEGRAEKYYPMSNADKSGTTFFMEPSEQLAVMKEIRELDLEMVAIFHSHPATPAYPSARDVELAFYPEVSYAIVSPRDSEKPEIRSFRIDEGEIREEEVIVR